MSALNFDAEWFTVTTGKKRGQRHIRGWMLSAIRVADGGDTSGWLSYAVCPRCHAMVLSDEQSAYGDQTWLHEQWHAQTDFPDHDPPEGTP